VRYIVDTNIAIAMLAHRQPVVERLSHTSPDEVGLSALVIAELLFGARRSSRVDQDVARVQALLIHTAALQSGSVVRSSSVVSN
jgi:tRNA(fMet)-specific endonuclease VapC